MKPEARSQERRKLGNYGIALEAKRVAVGNWQFPNYTLDLGNSFRARKM